MGKERKRHVQQDLPFKQRGGPRKGAGRPPKGSRSSERHKEREELAPNSILLVTLRADSEVGNLRRAAGYHAVRRGLYAIIENCEHFRIAHVSIQSNHIHLIVEADSSKDLAKGIQGFCISTAKHLNASIIDASGERRRGRVFSDRYHANLLGGPRQVRNALAYVLGNWRRHGEDRRDPARKIDPYSSGVVFAGWLELEDAVEVGRWFLDRIPRGYIPLSVAFPRTWLLRVGWKKSGKPISVYGVPGPKRDVLRR